jgi:hypothetical protein
MLEAVFPDPETMPNIVFYDNNCRLYKHLVHQGNLLYKTVGFPVDVFHWKCKHSKTEIECSYHCNPHCFPELIGEDGRGWYFNSSIAEQNNVWLGGFHSILREMTADHYDYFLDEMVLRKNRLTKEKLKDFAPGYLPVP